MQELQLNADHSVPAIARASLLPWVPSPQPGVERRMLERSGGEVAVATSIVRYAAGSRFSAHEHGLGEEFLVLEGVFSDESGDYPAGSYVRNPPGSRHAPHSDGGCVIFVKLRQMAADDKTHVVVPPAKRKWQSTGSRGHERALLYAARDEFVTLDRLEPNAVLDAPRAAAETEMLVVDGSVHRLAEKESALDRWTWMRTPGSAPAVRASTSGALLWFKYRASADASEGA